MWRKTTNWQGNGVVFWLATIRRDVPVSWIWKMSVNRLWLWESPRFWWARAYSMIKVTKRYSRDRKLKKKGRSNGIILNKHLSSWTLVKDPSRMRNAHFGEILRSLRMTFILWCFSSRLSKRIRRSGKGFRGSLRFFPRRRFIPRCADSTAWKVLSL